MTISLVQLIVFEYRTFAFFLRLVPVYALLFVHPDCPVICFCVVPANPCDRLSNGNDLSVLNPSRINLCKPFSEYSKSSRDWQNEQMGKPSNQESKLYFLAASEQLSKIPPAVSECDSSPFDIELPQLATQSPNNWPARSFQCRKIR